MHVSAVVSDRNGTNQKWTQVESHQFADSQCQSKSIQKREARSSICPAFSLILQCPGASWAGGGIFAPNSFAGVYFHFLPFFQSLLESVPQLKYMLGEEMSSFKMDT